MFGVGARVRVRILAATAPGLLPHLATGCGEAILTAFDPCTCEYMDSGAGCWLLLGSAMGRSARVEVRPVWGVGGVVPMAAGGMGLRAFSASCSFILLSFARASGMAGASDGAAGCSRRVPWGRGTRAEMWRAWGVEGAVLMAAGGARVFVP